MEKVKRPKKTSRNESSYQTLEGFQDSANGQFKNVYDKLDEITGKIDDGFEGPPGPQGPMRTTRTTR